MSKQGSGRNQHQNPDGRTRTGRLAAFRKHLSIYAASLVLIAVTVELSGIRVLSGQYLNIATLDASAINTRVTSLKYRTKLERESRALPVGVHSTCVINGPA